MNRKHLESPAHTHKYTNYEDVRGKSSDSPQYSKQCCYFLSVSFHLCFQTSLYLLPDIFVSISADTLSFLWLIFYWAVNLIRLPTAVERLREKPNDASVIRHLQMSQDAQTGVTRTREVKHSLIFLLNLDALLGFMTVPAALKNRSLWFVRSFLVGPQSEWFISLG